jgi:hypothetical protein
MTEPLRKAYSQDDLRAAAKAYMAMMFDSRSDRDAYFIRLGLLIDFVDTMWNEIPPTPDNSGSAT